MQPMQPHPSRCVVVERLAFRGKWGDEAFPGTVYTAQPIPQPLLLLLLSLSLERLVCGGVGLGLFLELPTRPIHTPAVVSLLLLLMMLSLILWL